MAAALAPAPLVGHELPLPCCTEAAADAPLAWSSLVFAAALLCNDEDLVTNLVPLEALAAVAATVHAATLSESADHTCEDGHASGAPSQPPDKVSLHALTAVGRSGRQLSVNLTVASHAAANVYASNLSLPGYAVWFGALNLADFCSRHLPLMAGKRVLELGCGATGFVGLALALWLDADAKDFDRGVDRGCVDAGEVAAFRPAVSRLVLTDGESELMPLLANNCKSNGYACGYGHGESTSASALSHSSSSPSSTSIIRAVTTEVGGACASAVAVAVAKLWWGDESDEAAVAAMAGSQDGQQVGLFDVILGADLVYSSDQASMSVPPLFATVGKMLAPEGRFYLAVTRRNFGVGCILEEASAAGFTWELDGGTIYDIFDNNIDEQTVLWRDAVYAFRRRLEAEPCPLTLAVDDAGFFEDDGGWA